MPVSALRPLRSRNFFIVWSAALISNVGSWMQAVALGVLVTATRGKAGWTGLVAGAAFLPSGLLAPFGGALADRFDHRRWLIATTIAEAGLAGVLAGVCFTGHARPVLVVVLAFAGGCASALGFPTYQAMLPSLVKRDDLLAAVSLSSAQFNFGRVVGPALSAFLLPASTLHSRSHMALRALTIGAGWVFLANAASFGAVVVALLLIRLSRTHKGPIDRAGVINRIVEGARVAASEPGCRAAIILIGVVALIGSPFIALVPAVSIVGLHAGSHGTAVLVAAQGVGAIAGALAIAPLARWLGRPTMLILALFTVPVCLSAYGAAPDLALATVAIMAVGGSYVGVLSGLNTVVQLRAPQAARGRVIGLYMASLGTIYPIGALIEGQLGDVAGIRVVTAGSGVALFVVLSILFVSRRSLFAALSDPPGHPMLEGSSSASPL